jgi:hypothetical protein
VEVGVPAGRLRLAREPVVDLKARRELAAAARGDAGECAAA